MYKTVYVLLADCDNLTEVLGVFDAILAAENYIEVLKQKRGVEWFDLCSFNIIDTTHFCGNY